MDGACEPTAFPVAGGKLERQLALACCETRQAIFTSAFGAHFSSANKFEVQVLTIKLCIEHVSLLN